MRTKRHEFQRPNIVAVYEHYELRITGADRSEWRKAECPLPDHEDGNPSASINEDTGKWYCHACDQGGDGIDLIRARENVGQSDALRIGEAITGSGSVGVRRDSGSSGLLPRGSGHREGRRNFTPPWTRL